MSLNVTVVEITDTQIAEAEAELRSRLLPEFYLGSVIAALERAGVYSCASNRGANLLLEEWRKTGRARESRRNVWTFTAASL